MKLKFKKLKYYFLSCNNPTRVEHMNKEFSEYNITQVSPVSIETGISKDDYFVYRNIKPYEEIFLGSNNVVYKHIYYF